MTGIRGSVLVLTLWTLFFLSALAIAVAARVDAGLKLASWCKTRTEAYSLAEAGVERAIMEVLADTNTSWDATTESWGNNEAVFKNAGLGEGTFSVYHMTCELGGMTVTNYGLIDEESRINLSKASSNLLASLVTTAGGVDSASANDVAAAIVDWRNREDDVLTGGAGNNYYKGLSDPMRRNSAAFQLVHELLLVKGVSLELFQRLEPHVTVYGTGKVNINTADSMVLASVALTCGGNSATCASLARKVVALRQGQVDGRASAGGDIIRQVMRPGVLASDEGKLLSQMIPYLTLQSTCFRGIAEGRSSGRETGHEGAVMLGDISRIEFVFDRAHRTRVFWYEN
jgi:type II secretory pathway component PulK